MSTERETRISTLVDSTFDLSLEQLRSFLERECPNDPELRAEVERRICERETMAPRRGSGTPADPLSAGAIIAGRYRISRLIGRGGMGEVYEADDLLMNEPVAIKTLRADLAAQQDLVDRFQQEIYLARKVTHPNVCRIYEVGLHPSVTLPPGASTAGPHEERVPPLFFAMELLRGETLAERLSRGPMTRAEAFPIAEQLGEGLQAAHRAGIVHADFKSGNVILVPSDGGVRAVITDFGVARLDPERTSVEHRPFGETLRVAGTLAYMSPEQRTGAPITAASDLYSFGIVLYEMACGRRPFDDRDPIDALLRPTTTEPPPIRARVPGIDPRWETAIARCLETDPRSRFASAGELAAWFRGGWWRPARYWTRQDWIRTAAALVALSLAAGGGWTWWNQPYRPPAAAQQFYDVGLDALHSMSYETARKALEQAVAIDPGFALAHASLARAYDELDYTERAKDAMLRAVAAAQESRLRAEDEERVRALQFMVSRDYARAAPLVRTLESAAVGSSRAPAALESGWLAQQMEDSGEAAAAFERALAVNPSYAAARLRLGFLLGRQGGKDAQALAAFTDAERLYQAAGNVEGVTQTKLERANLLDRRNRETEALPVIDQGLDSARRVGNRFQEIRLLFLQATALRDLGQIARATELTRQTIDQALAENMDNLAASGLIDLGNIYLRSGDLKTAEPHFRRALDIARRSSVRRIEARALVSLGSLCEQDHRPAEARTLIQAGLSFYRQSGYRRESVQAATILGGVMQQLGEYADGIAVLEDALPGAETLHDQQVEGQLRERLADNLRGQGHWPKALVEYQRAIDLRGPIVQTESIRLTMASLQADLGLDADARTAIATAERFGQGANRIPRLRDAITVARARIAYADGRFDEATALSDASDVDRGDAPELVLLRSLALVRTGRVTEGKTRADRALAAMETAALHGDAARARLLLAEAFLASGARDDARQLALDALRYFEPRQIAESVWRGHAIVARTAAPPEADVHRDAARRALSTLRTNWTPPIYERYHNRAEIKRLSSGLALE